MTKKQCEQFNRMRLALIRIRSYQSSERLLSKGEDDWGVSGSDALEMAYENIQGEAARAVKGVRAVALEEKRSGAKQQATAAETPLPDDDDSRDGVFDDSWVDDPEAGAHG